MSKPDSFKAIARDSWRTVQRHARNAVAVVGPHVTLDNAQKVATLVATLTGAHVALHPRPVPPAPPPKSRGGR